MDEDMAHLNEIEDYLGNDLSDQEKIDVSEMNHSEQFFLEGLNSDVLPSELFKRKDNEFFPSHF